MLGIALEEVVVDGKKLKRLPQLTNDNVIGKSVLISVQDDDYKSDYGRLSGKVAILQSTWNNGSTVSTVPINQTVE